MKIQRMRALVWLFVILGCWTPSYVHALCAQPSLDLYWLSIQDGDVVAPGQSIFLAHNPDAIITATLDGELLEPTYSDRYHTEYRLLPSQHAGESRELVFVLQGSDFRGHPASITETVVFSVDEGKLPMQGTELSILSSTPSPQIPEDVCQTIFRKAFCSDDLPLQPHGLELSGGAVAYMVEVPNLTSRRQPNRLLWPGECAPQVDVTYSPYCYRVIAFDERGQQHVGPENCLLVPDEEEPQLIVPRTQSDSGCSFAGPSRQASFGSLLLLVLGLFLRRNSLVAQQCGLTAR